MPKRISLYVMLLVFVGVFLNHFSVQKKDNGYLLVVDGREVDAVGMFKDQWLVATRNCKHVQAVAPTERKYLEIKQLVQAYSPPNSESAHLVSLMTTANWYLAEVKFKELLPAVVLIQQTDAGLQIVPNAIWSGETHPWRAGPYIRSYISTKVPHAPKAILDCFEKS
jgi:hypothetical protein